NGTTYYYKVKAVNSGGISGYANETSATPVAPLAINAGPSPVSPGGTVTVTITGGPGGATDWVGLFAVGADNYTYSDYQYMNGATSATKTFTMPSVVGSYEFRFFPNDSYTLLGTSNTVT